MTLDFLSIPENESFARVAVSAFAVQMDPTLDVLADIKTAVSEAVTNAIVHGYAEKTGMVRIRAELKENGLLCLSAAGRGTVRNGVLRDADLYGQGVRRFRPRAGNDCVYGEAYLRP